MEVHEMKMPKIKRESRQFIVINEEKLISEVQNRPILYDKALKGYRKPAIREGAWQEVADTLESTVEECKKRWRSLRDAFMKQYKLYQRPDQSFNSSKKRWIFYDQMEFLAPFFDASINGIKFDLDDDFIETVAADMDGNDQSTMNKMQAQGNRHIVCISHPTETEYQVHEIEDYNEDQMEEEEDEHMMERTISKDEKKTITNNHGELYNTIYMNGDSDEQNQDGQLQTHHQSRLQRQQHNQPQSKYPYSNDADERFLLSCLPALQRLPKKKNALARLKFQQILFDLEFDEETDEMSAGNESARN